MNEEPSVLDYLKARLFHPDRLPIDLSAPAGDSPAGEAPGVDAPNVAVEHAPANGSATIDAAEGQPLADTVPVYAADIAEPAAPRRWPWLLTAALFLALVGQYSLGPREGAERRWASGAALLTAGAGMAILSVIAGELPKPRQSDIPEKVDPPTITLMGVGLGVSLAVGSFVLFRAESQLFTAVDLIPLFGSLLLMIYSLWASGPETFDWRKTWQKLAAPRRLGFSVEWPNSAFKILAVLAAIGVTLFFRLHRLGEVPPEMNSDHAEKLLDILRVLSGQWQVFFPTNGGREALIFYLGAALHRFFGLPLGFMLLKIGSTLIGLAALPFLYALGKEIGGRRVGWLAFTLAGIAYWPNVVSRFGLHLPFYFLFTAALLYFVVRGLRHGRRNDFIYAGLALGLGLYGYTPDRLLFLPALLAVGLFLLHSRGRDKRLFGLMAVLTIALVSFVLFIPLLSYILAEPQAFLARTLTRIADIERPLEAPGWRIFLQNVGRALGMFSWNSGEIWPVSIPGYPALNVVSGALFYVGAAILLGRYLKHRNWVDLFLLLCIPLLQLPSTLALAFPAENPNLYRTGGAIIPVFLMAAIALDAWMRALQAAQPSVTGRAAIWMVAIAIIGLAAFQDYAWVFDKFQENYRNSAWNSSEMGLLAREFGETFGSPDTVYVMAYPHWVDSRLVAANAGFPERDFRLDIDQIESTTADPRPKLFILFKEDQAALDALRQIYPRGWVSQISSKVPTKEFQVYFAPPALEATPEP